MVAPSFEGITSLEASFLSGDRTLHGTLTLPETNAQGRRPAFLIVHDIGPMDRDGVVDGSLGIDLPSSIPLYRLLAEALSRRGFAVLRYDKRSCTRASNPRCDADHTPQSRQPDDLAEALTQDARSALAWVQDHPRVNASRVYVIGHGQGAEIGALMLADPRPPAGLVLAAPWQSPIDTIIDFQLRTSLELVTAQHRSLRARGESARADTLQTQATAIKEDLDISVPFFEALREDQTPPSPSLFGVPVATWRSMRAMHERATRALSSDATRDTAILALLPQAETTLPPLPDLSLEHIERVELEETTHNLIDISSERLPTLSTRAVDAMIAFAISAPGDATP